MALNLSEQIGGNNLQNVSKNSNGFIQHVTRFDTETKSELSNLLQYLVIVIVPIYILNRTINGVIPDFNESKGNIELLGEVVMQVISLLLGVFIIHRIVTFIPTFSGNNLSEINFMNVVLIIVFSGLNSENGKKINHVYNRLLGAWNGENPKKPEKNDDSAVVKVSQPISGNPLQAPQATHQASRADYVNTHQQMGTGALSQVVQQVQTGQQQNNAVGTGGQQGSPDMGMMGGGLLAEPMAANAGFGAFSSF
uniref:Uncharacterized protein n=1 Tax=viral metagenome TaxID=1070528 RepID=A0A6C0LY78_9ZZZZ